MEQREDERCSEEGSGDLGRKERGNYGSPAGALMVSCSFLLIAILARMAL